ncbi:MAG TPA: hypothetical protein VHQ45_14745 [Gemmatimonadaceae bacterium]|nr:hypothetical protein [Gemmatimonadaceae bacterium]
MLRVRIDDGGRTYQLGPSDFIAEPAGTTAIYRSRELSTRTRGTLRMAYALVAPSGDTASLGQVELPLRSDWVYSVNVMPDTSDPAQRCFGCQGSRAFGLTAAYVRPDVDKVYVTWGGNSISNPVIY